MDCVIVIPARYGSSRFPGKPLHPIAGEPLLKRVVRAALSSQKASRVIVATDDRRIFSLAESSGAEAVMTEDFATGSDRVYSVVKNLSCDVVVNLQGDEPLILGKNIDDLIDVVSKSDCGVATLISDLQVSDLSKKNVVKVWLDQASQALFFSRQVPEAVASFEKDQKPYKHIGVYAYKKPVLEKFSSHPSVGAEMAESLEQIRALYLREKIKCVLVTNKLIGVDRIKDALEAENYLRDHEGRDEKSL